MFSFISKLSHLDKLRMLSEINKSMTKDRDAVSIIESQEKRIQELTKLVSQLEKTIESLTTIKVEDKDWRDVFQEEE